MPLLGLNHCFVRAGDMARSRHFCCDDHVAFIGIAVRPAGLGTGAA